MKPIKKLKHSYLLLELIIAIALLSLFLVPMLGSPLIHVKKQKAELLSLLLQNKSENLLIDLEEKLVTGAIPWQTLLESSRKKKLLESISPLKLEQGFPLVEANIYLVRSTFAKNNQGTSLGKVNVLIEFKRIPDKKKKEKEKDLFLKKTCATFFVSKKNLTPALEHEKS